jgi:hypothetical protein
MKAADEFPEFVLIINWSPCHTGCDTYHVVVELARADESPEGEYLLRKADTPVVHKVGMYALEADQAGADKSKADKLRERRKLQRHRRKARKDMEKVKVNLSPVLETTNQVDCTDKSSTVPPPMEVVKTKTLYDFMNECPDLEIKKNKLELQNGEEFSRFYLSGHCSDMRSESQRREKDYFKVPHMPSLYEPRLYGPDRVAISEERRDTSQKVPESKNAHNVYNESVYLATRPK